MVFITVVSLALCAIAAVVAYKATQALERANAMYAELEEEFQDVVAQLTDRTSRL